MHLTGRFEDRKRSDVSRKEGDMGRYGAGGPAERGV